MILEEVKGRIKQRFWQPQRAKWLKKKKKVKSKFCQEGISAKPPHIELGSQRAPPKSREYWENLGLK